MLVATEQQRKIRAKELVKEEEQELRELEEARKNKGFTQVYSRGWRRVRELAKGNSAAAALYAFFAEHIDPTCGAVICDQQFLADQFEVTTRTIRRWLDYLEEEQAIVRIPVSGRVCAYALDPHEVWKGYNTSKAYAAFVTKTLVNKDGDIQRRIMSMFSPNNDKPEEVKERERLEKEMGQQRLVD
ncbi:helix-turn-helix domain-containing protein [Proteus mirabilis]|jgi:Fe2+ or Zn2+ uptake regulation protein|uniref:helix-turn-helix domain-containing protein n=2 Tax=Bacteria TaxID=2 RepID=UPI001F047DB3|nr:helix-turn-helix domain-containing protein [Providencia rettgeri]MCG9952321.1 helix-turn-helix domain-containing protein [Providencia rettgeri]